MIIETILGHNFRDRHLIEEALTHPGRAEIRKKLPFNYQRLEFLGDSVLGLVVAELLYRHYPAESEGNLARRLAALVREESLADVARALGIGPHMRVLDADQDKSREQNSGLADVCEALIGALYLDGGYEAARRFIQSQWEPLARSMNAPPKDAKTQLQEWAQGRGLPLPEYRLAMRQGPAHAPEFTIQVILQGHAPQEAKAFSKRQAEQTAAQALLDTFSGGG